MARLLFVLFVAATGLGLSVQAAANARMGGLLGVPPAGALVNFLVGSLALAAVSFSGLFGPVQASAAGEAPWWAWIGGFFGATYVTMTVVAVPRIGTAVTFAAVIFGQLLGSMILDANGWLGVPEVPLSASRVLGAVLLFAGVLLIQKG